MNTPSGGSHSSTVNDFAGMASDLNDNADHDVDPNLHADVPDDDLNNATEL